jgi:hypothetical protein
LYLLRRWTCSGARVKFAVLLDELAKDIKMTFRHVLSTPAITVMTRSSVRE